MAVRLMSGSSFSPSIKSASSSRSASDALRALARGRGGRALLPSIAPRLLAVETVEAGEAKLNMLAPGAMLFGRERCETSGVLALVSRSKLRNRTPRRGVGAANMANILRMTCEFGESNTRRVGTLGLVRATVVILMSERDLGAYSSLLDGALKVRICRTTVG